jgi:GT2 family glycosyltransferase
MSIDKKINYSFIILRYNQWELTLQTIETLIKSLNKATITEGIEIILVDNGSTDSRDQEVFQFMKDSKFRDISTKQFRLEENMGYPVGINYGISKAEGNILIILNNDLIFSQGWFKPLVDYLRKEPDIGVVAPYLSNASGMQDVGFYETDLDIIHKYAIAFMRNHQGDTIETNRVIGACMVIKREVIEQVGGNDFWFGPGHYDDDDWCLRIRIAGYKIAVIGNSFIYHIGSASFRSSMWNVNQIIQHNKMKFISKWQLDIHETSRDKLIESSIFSSKKHYEPIINADFCNQKDGDDHKVDGALFIADWYSDASAWRKKLEEILKEKANEKYFIWVPNPYFNLNESKDLIALQDFIYLNSVRYALYKKNISCIHTEVPNIYLLQFVNRFNHIIKIENDVINSYIIKVKEDSL